MSSIIAFYHLHCPRKTIEREADTQKHVEQDTSLNQSLEELEAKNKQVILLEKQVKDLEQKLELADAKSKETFLPQDRVCEFAKLTLVQLLGETEKAIGDPQLPVQHQDLVAKSKRLKELKNKVEQVGLSLNQEKSLNAEQEKDVERVRQREELLAKVESMKKKLPWLKYDMKKAKYMKAKKLENDAKRKLDEAAKTLNDLREPIEYGYLVKLITIYI